VKNAALFLAVVNPIFWLGCEAPPSVPVGERTVCNGFVPSSVHVAGLTQFIENPEGKQPQTLRVFVELRDLYDSKLKAPFTLRIELYKYVQHSSNPRGLHVQTWPDFVLTDQNTNQVYWRDYLRAYEFLLEVNPPVSMNESMLLEVTCYTGESKSLSNTYILNPK
jgi:hypothetical protein